MGQGARRSNRKRIGGQLSGSSAQALTGIRRSFHPGFVCKKGDRPWDVGKLAETVELRYYEKRDTCPPPKSTVTFLQPSNANRKINLRPWAVPNVSVQGRKIRIPCCVCVCVWCETRLGTLRAQLSGLHINRLLHFHHGKEVKMVRQNVKECKVVKEILWHGRQTHRQCVKVACTRPYLLIYFVVLLT